MGNSNSGGDACCLPIRIVLGHKTEDWIAQLSGPSYGQGHLFQGKSEAQREAIAKQLLDVDKKVAGGLLGYIERARTLLSDAKEGKNPFEGLSPEVPEGENLSASNGPGSAMWAEYEKIGMGAIGGCCFCLVAGGMGERLGYSGIKIELAPECLTKKRFIEVYIEHILAFRDYARKKTNNPNLEMDLAIMTSGDTNPGTVKLMEDNDYFGFPKQCCTIMMQEKVPALADSDARISLDDQGNVETKPHGHGDVHTLLHTTGLAKKWLGLGKTHVLFFQDTNPLPFRSLCALLGVSVKKQFSMNSVTVPRCPGEAVGGIAKLVGPGGSGLTINVEYNQLDPLLKSTPTGGDVADKSGFSPYPGNINVLLMELSSYQAALARTGGVMPEFVNPKYADPEKMKFKKPTRLECMMQEFPRLLGPSDKAGFTQMDRFMCFTCVKNSFDEAIAKVKAGQPADTALSCEADVYNSNVKLLQLAGVQFYSRPIKYNFRGINADIGAKVVLAPSFGISFEEIKRRVKGSVTITSKSILILDGDISLEGLALDGSLAIVANPGSTTVIKKKTIENRGGDLVAVTDDSEQPDFMKIRGYDMKIRETAKL